MENGRKMPKLRDLILTVKHFSSCLLFLHKSDPHLLSEAIRACERSNQGREFIENILIKFVWTWQGEAS